tara:strand:+ start:1515 stop:1754 length:240 start_codon:yes stop_codon:yes gene_type:complete
VTTKAMKPITKVSKTEMIKAIVNLENAVDTLMKQTAMVDGALREYIIFNKDAEKFQAHLDKIQKERMEKDGEPIKPESE